MHTCHWIAALFTTLGLGHVARFAVRHRAWNPWVEPVEFDHGSLAQFKYVACEKKCEGDRLCIEDCGKPWVALKEYCSDAAQVKMCHVGCGQDFDCHKQCPLPKDPALKEKVVDTLECHAKCGDDEECHGECHHESDHKFHFVHEKCALLEPGHKEHHHHHHHGWHHAMEEQDETLTKYCSDAMQVKMCHARCGHDGNCHRECPLPKDADLKAKVMENMECHAKCGDDHACHHECHHSGGSSFREVHEKCRMMDFEEHHHHHHGWHHHAWHHAMEKKPKWAFAAVEKPAFMDPALTEYCSDAMKVTMCHAKCGHDGNCHKECPLPKDADLKAKVMENMECHAKCGDEHACHHECHHSGGCPFREVHEKCHMMDSEEHHHHHHGWHHQAWHHVHHVMVEKPKWAFAAVEKPAFMDPALTEYCSDAMQVRMCHARCGHDLNCHRECPLPKDADLKAKVLEKTECHAKCGDDHACHEECGCPFHELHEKCGHVPIPLGAPVAGEPQTMTAIHM